jgi:hypothetical protein
VHVWEGPGAEHIFVIRALLGWCWDAGMVIHSTMRIFSDPPSQLCTLSYLSAPSQDPPRNALLTFATIDESAVQSRYLDLVFVRKHLRCHSAIRYFERQGSYALVEPDA